MNIQQRLPIWFLLTVPLLFALSAFEFEIDGAVSTNGLLWMVQFLVALALLPLVSMNAGDGRSIRCWTPWLLWYGFVWLSIIWSNPGARNVQEAVQLSMPLLIGLLASRSFSSREDLGRLLAAFRWAIVPLLLFGLIYATKSANLEWLERHTRATALSAVFLGCVFLAELPGRFVLPLAGWSLCLLVTVLTESRMATVALLAVPIVHPCFRSKWWNVAMAGAAIVAAVALFNTRVFQERFFPFTGHGTLADVLDGSFISQGRFEAWPLILDEALKRPVLGFGVGSAYDFVATVWPDMNYAHNDYLRIGFELGWVGLIGFVLAATWQVIGLGMRIKASDGILRKAYAASWLGFCGLLITSTTDNTIIYNAFYTDPLFVVLGAAYGVSIAESSCESAAEKLQPRSHRRNVALRNRQTSYTA